VLDHVACDGLGDVMVEGGFGNDGVGWSREEKDAVFFQFVCWSERW
jgi:hypothetical protein